MYDIPHDAQWGDIDVMDRELDFTISPDRYSGSDSTGRPMSSKTWVGLT